MNKKEEKLLDRLRQLIFIRPQNLEESEENWIEAKKIITEHDKRERERLVENVLNEVDQVYTNARDWGQSKSIFKEIINKYK